MDLSALARAGLRVSADTLDTHAYARDLWPRATLELTGGVLPPSPAVVAWPENAEQVEAALDWARAEDVLVVPYGAGSGVCGAAAGRAGSLVLDTKRLDHLGAVDVERRAVRLGPGLLGAHMEARLEREGWTVGHSPSSLWCSTVGGYAAARSAGQFSSRYGVFDDMLLGLRAVAPSGPLSAGVWTPSGEEDLLPVLCGSEGALGVITDCLVRVSPVPELRRFRGYAFGSLEAAWDGMRAVMQAGLWPSVLRLYDAVDTHIGGKLGGKKAHKAAAADKTGRAVLKQIREAVMGVPGLRRHLLDLPLALPGLVNRLASGLGKDVLLIIGFEGPAALVELQHTQAAALLSAGRDLGPEPGEAWYAHRHDVSYKAAPVYAAGGFADTMEVAATWANLPGLYQAVVSTIARHAVVMAHFSHVYREGCSIYFSFAGAGKVDVYDRLWTEALDAARASGGTVTHHHGVGQLKASAAAREAGAAVRVWREIKAKLDPDDRMNPGRLFPADVPVEAGPPPPRGGPVFQVDRRSLLAEVDPAAPVEQIERGLASEGLALRIRPDRPLVAWLSALERGALHAWETPVFGVQARFSDGVSARIGVAPRSAAGPDLRFALLRRARPELLEVPVRALGSVEVRAPAGADPEAWRPDWAADGVWSFAGDAGRALADGLGEPGSAVSQPTRAAERPHEAGR